jgi:hypothetical protein
MVGDACCAEQGRRPRSPRPAATRWQSATSRVHGVMSVVAGKDGLALALGVDVAARGAVVPRCGEGRGGQGRRGTASRR